MSVLIVPIDASQIPAEQRKQRRIKIAIQQRNEIKSQVIPVESDHAEIKLEVDPKQAVSVAVGPDNIPDEDLFHFQTLTATITPRQWREKTLTIPPLVITLPWWTLWWRWCRDFLITGRVVCADGSPVPGAEVRAYDVDFFWWWSSILQVGPSAITDASGHFAIKFRWCCGWWPWWWWRLRQWRLDPHLLEKVYPIVKLNPNLNLPEPVPIPSLEFGGLRPHPLPPHPSPLPPNVAAGGDVDPSIIPTIRERLISVLPHVPELERLRIWPWWPWTPWFDCSPDILFRVTQICGGQTKIIVNENVFQIRWDIPTHLDLTLAANKEACCLPSQPPDPEGDCALITGVCGDPGIPVTSIGGNSGAPATPVGYADPGNRDRPFSEVVTVSGQFGTAAQADFYEIEYAPHGLNAWAPLPGGALLDMTRGYFDATQPWPFQWFYIAFPVKSSGGKFYYESRQHYEATHPPANWGSALAGRTWFYNVNLLASIQTNGHLADGAYDFRIVGYRAGAGGDLDPTTRHVMDGCGNHPENNLLVLRIDNRIVGLPTPGTVHINTTEPDCGINSVKLGGTVVQPCGTQQLEQGTSLEVEFFVADSDLSLVDPQFHLDHYELRLKFDKGSEIDLLAVGGTLSVISGGPQGPDYSNAVTLPQTAVRPSWKGGALRLHINDATTVFKKTCCYLIELTAWKRNIVSCDGHLTYYNQDHYSFTVIV